MEGKCIWKDGLITSMKVAAWDSGCIERKAHVRKARANKLGVDRWVMREGGAQSKFMIIKLLREGVLDFEAQGRGANLPEVRRVF